MTDPWKENPDNPQAPAQPASSSRPADDKAWQLLEKAVLAGVQEQRRSRRRGIIIKSRTFLYRFGAIFQIVTALRNAFEDSATKGIILRINSPGGSPVQSGYIYDEIRRLRQLHPDIAVHAVITDLGASGAYYIASAADQIHADKASLVGSIGVTAASFGFVETMEKLGVERRVYTSGEHKAFLDPFQPQKNSETEFWQSVLGTTHQQFINAVKQGRGERLKWQQHPEVFSGLIWSGEQALELGLIDSLASSSQVARELIGESNMVDFSVEESPFDRFAKRFGASVAQQLGLYMGLQQAPQLR
ncbi:MAG: S49 family peptidase [Thiopseudomonas sp.]